MPAARRAVTRALFVELRARMAYAGGTPAPSNSVIARRGPIDQISLGAASHGENVSLWNPASRPSDRSGKYAARATPIRAFAAATRRSAAATSGLRSSSVDASPVGIDGTPGSAATGGSENVDADSPTSAAIACSSSDARRCRTHAPGERKLRLRTRNVGDARPPRWRLTVSCHARRYVSIVCASVSASRSAQVEVGAGDGGLQAEPDRREVIVGRLRVVAAGRDRVADFAPQIDVGFERTDRSRSVSASMPTVGSDAAWASSNSAAASSCRDDAAAVRARDERFEPVECRVAVRATSRHAAGDRLVRHRPTRPFRETRSAPERRRAIGRRQRAAGEQRDAAQPYSEQTVSHAHAPSP